MKRVSLLLLFSITLSACNGTSSDDSAGATAPPATAERSAPARGGTDEATGDGGAGGDEVDEVDDVIVSTPPVVIEGEPTDHDPPAPPPGSTTPAVTVAPPPAGAIVRIVSLSPTHTETLFAIGAADALVGVDTASRYPDAAIALQQPGLTSSLADVGPIAALSPDVVVLGDDPTGLERRLAEAGIATWRGAAPTSLDEALAQIERLGDVVGHRAEAADLAASLRAELAELRAGLPADGTLTYFHEIDPSLVTTTPGHFLDEIYRALGLTSIVPVGGGVDATAPGGVTIVTPDAVVAADPDVIILADVACCAVTAAGLADRAGWGDVSAVRTGAIVELPDRITERWGPSLIEYWRLVASAARTAAAAG